MTEAEWLAANDPRPMLELLEGRASDRKLRLLACACARRLSACVSDDGAMGVILVSERYADGLVGDAELKSARAAAISAIKYHDGEISGSYAMNCVYALPAYSARHAASAGLQFAAQAQAILDAPDDDYRERDPAESAAQARIVSDVFGNPFRPVEFDAAWRTTDVRLLAEGIYEERAFDRMPILADALQDADCDSDDILDHLRDANATHVRGCWALDLVLDKE
jgi:hypothetical protein